MDDTNGLIYGSLFGLPPSAFLPPLDFSDWEEEERRVFQELRLSRSRENGFAWTTGVVYFRSELDVELDNRSTFSPVLNGDRDAHQVIDFYTAYGEVIVPIGPRLEGAFAIDGDWSVAGGIAWTDSDIRDDDSSSSSVPGNPAPNVPELSATFTLNYQGGTMAWNGPAFDPFISRSRSGSSSGR